jgi:Tat protein secretion system quality control protein TatD with DNase activity
LLIETDGPIHFGGSFHKKTTTLSFIPQVVKAIAETKEMKETDVADQILENFIDFFDINQILA